MVEYNPERTAIGNNSGCNGTSGAIEYALQYLALIWRMHILREYSKHKYNRQSQYVVK